MFTVVSVKLDETTLMAEDGTWRLHRRPDWTDADGTMYSLIAHNTLDTHSPPALAVFRSSHSIDDAIEEFQKFKKLAEENNA